MVFTRANVNIGTVMTGRGQRGINIDAKEFMALRNVVHFKSKNFFEGRSYDLISADTLSNPKEHIRVSLPAFKRSMTEDEKNVVQKRRKPNLAFACLAADIEFSKIKMIQYKEIT